MAFPHSSTRRQLWKSACCSAALLTPWRIGWASKATFAADSVSDPWTASELMEPEELAKALKAADARPQIICTTFPVLYRQRHIAGALYAGPGGKPEGVAQLKSVFSKLDKSAPVVLYCGCCPMTKCPNIRPAFVAAKQSGMKSVRVLNLPTNLHADWVAKGFPVES